MARPVARVPFRIRSGEGRVVRGDLRLPSATAGPESRTDVGPGAAVVVCHGFKGFKDWGFFPHACDTLARRLGCAVVSFNFSGSGVGPDLGRFSDPDAFAHNTFSREVEDLDAVIEGLTGGRLGDAACPPAARLAALGHSRGAVAVALAASRHPSIRAIATWAGLCAPERYEALFTEKAESRGWAEIRNLRTGEVLRLCPDVVRDLRENRQRLDPLAALADRSPPLLVVHGEADEAVPLSDARALATAASDSELFLLPRTAHTFGAVHPFAGSTPALERVLDRTARHFHERLVEETPHAPPS